VHRCDRRSPLPVSQDHRPNLVLIVLNRDDGTLGRHRNVVKAEGLVCVVNDEIDSKGHAESLLREIRDEHGALEMVRRAEYALGKAIRAGEEDGTVVQRGRPWARENKVADAATLPRSQYDYATHSDLYGDGREGGNGVLAMADKATEPEFEAALAEAKVSPTSSGSKTSVTRSSPPAAAASTSSSPVTCTANSARTSRPSCFHTSRSSHRSGPSGEDATRSLLVECRAWCHHRGVNRS
jgi:hypothetical protein